MGGMQDTEMQVVIVGAGRADLVAQTKVGRVDYANGSKQNGWLTMFTKKMVQSLYWMVVTGT